jgi:hypothetical protein
MSRILRDFALHIVLAGIGISHAYALDDQGVGNTATCLFASSIALLASATLCAISEVTAFGRGAR